MDTSPAFSGRQEDHPEKPPLAEEAKHRAEELKESSHRTVEQAKEAGRKLGQQSAEYSRTLAIEQKNRLAERIHELQQAAEAACQRLRSENHQALATRFEAVGNRLGDFSVYLKDSEPRDLVADAERLARRRPELVFGGMFVAGLAAARFLKASRKSSPTEPAPMGEPTAMIAQETEVL